jgi:hypothetical protein
MERNLIIFCNIIVRMKCRWNWIELQRDKTSIVDKFCDSNSTLLDTDSGTNILDINGYLGIKGLLLKLEEKELF